MINCKKKNYLNIYYYKLKMEYNWHHKKDQYSTIFSQLPETKKIRRYSFLTHNLSKLQDSVTILNYYSTKGKINSNNNKNVTISSQKPMKTEQSYRSKTFKNFVKNVINLEAKKKRNESRNKMENILKNKKNKNMTKSQFNDSLNLKKNLFVTNINYRNTRKNISKIITNTSYKDNTSFSREKPNILPFLSKTRFNPNSSDISFIKSNKNNQSSYSKNKTLSHNKSSSLEKENLPKVANKKIKNLKKENNNIKKMINKGIEKFNIMEWYMKTRFKYAQYKYGIAEIDKYFMDLKSYGKPEEEEIEKRKTFYEHVEDVIDDIHKVQQKKEIEKLNKKYGIDQDKKKIEKSKKNKKEFNIPQQNQMVELSRAQKEIEKRRKMEKQKRKEIEDILFKCKQSLYSINSFENKLPK